MSSPEWEPFASRPLPDIKRYKSYPVPHFSGWRAVYQRFLTLTFVSAYVFGKYRLVISGRENVPRTGRIIVGANHISMLDPLVIAIAVGRPMAFMAKRELFNKWWKAAFYRSVGCFALDRDNPDSATLKTALNVLKSPCEKWSLMMFPEGTRSTDGEVLPLKKGLGGLAQKTGTPVLPVGISKDPQGRIHVRIGRLITDLQNADAIQERLYVSLVELTRPE